MAVMQYVQLTSASSQKERQITQKH